MTTESDPTPPGSNRRQILVKGIAGALGQTGLAARALAEDGTPSTAARPYWVDEVPYRSDIRTDPATGNLAVGLPIRLVINVSQLDAGGDPTPLPNAVVDIWHCNALGIFSDDAAQGTSGMKFLRGYQVTNAHGNVRFITIYPGWYSSRTAHVHVRVRLLDAFTGAEVYNQVTQLFFDDIVTDRIHVLAPYNERPNRDTHDVGGTIRTADGDGDGRVDGG